MLVDKYTKYLGFYILVRNNQKLKNKLFTVTPEMIHFCINLMKYIQELNAVDYSNEKNKRKK